MSRLRTDGQRTTDDGNVNIELESAKQDSQFRYHIREVCKKKAWSSKRAFFCKPLYKRSHFSLKNLDLVSNFEIKDRNS